MKAIRIMTYRVCGCRGGDGRIDPDRVVEVIAAGRPDIVALQDIDATPPLDQLAYLGKRLGMPFYGHSRSECNAFLSYFPVSGLREYDLGDGGRCVRADVDIHGRRLHLFNLCLSMSLRQRHRQVINLLDEGLLGDDRLVCPLLLLGDFGDIVWTLTNLELSLRLRRAYRPLWAATYPARFPLVGRDRAYLRGKIRILDAYVERSATARRASRHLPLILTAEIDAPGCYLRVEELKRARMEAAPG